jgi:hypothetical protein
MGKILYRAGPADDRAAEDRGENEADDHGSNRKPDSVADTPSTYCM